MRTTIELSDEHRSLLHSLAARRGLRGYSKVVQEAIEFYLKEEMGKEIDLGAVLNMRGSWDKAEVQRVKKRLAEIRRNWKIV